MAARLRRRRIALLLLILLSFAQVNVALAGCFMDRASMANNAGMEQPCEDGSPNVCVLHCTSDLQLTGTTAGLVPDVIETAIFVVPRFEFPPPAKSALDGPPVAPPPRRILLHSFLI